MAGKGLPATAISSPGQKPEAYNEHDKSLSPLFTEKFAGIVRRRGSFYFKGLTANSLK